MINLSDKYYITIHHLKLYKPSKRKQKKLNCLLKDYAIRSALKIVKHWRFTSYTKSHDHTYYVARNNFNLPSQVTVETYKSDKKAQFHGQIEVTLINNRGFKLINNKGRFFAKVLIEVRHSIYCPLAFGQYQLSKIKTAKLYKYKSQWYLDLIMEYKQPKKETDNYAGVDFGIVKPAIFSVLNNYEDIVYQECISGIKLRFMRMRYKQKRKAKDLSSHSKATSLIAKN